MLRGFAAFAAVSSCLLLFAFLIAQPVQARLKDHRAPAGRAPIAQPPAGAAAPADVVATPAPVLAVDPAKLSKTFQAYFKPILKATYECRDKTGKGEGCSAGCASASFSPVTRLTVVLGSLLVDGENIRFYYYLVEFPKAAGKGAKGVDKAEGFRRLIGTLIPCQSGVTLVITISGTENPIPAPTPLNEKFNIP